VNDVNLENIDHDFAVATLKATKQRVRLLVGRQSYNAVDGSPTQPVTSAAAQPAQGFTIDWMNEWLKTLKCIVQNTAVTVQKN